MIIMISPQITLYCKGSPSPLDVPLKYFAHYINPLSLPGDYQLRSVHAAKHVWVAVITN